MVILIVAQYNALCNKFIVAINAIKVAFGWYFPSDFKKIAACSGVRIAIRTPEIPLQKTEAAGR